MHRYNGRHVGITITLSVAAAVTALLTALPTAAQAQGGRKMMEQCVDHVLSRLAHVRAAEAQIGPAVLPECRDELLHPFVGGRVDLQLMCPGLQGHR